MKGCVKIFRHKGSLQLLHLLFSKESSKMRRSRCCHAAYACCGRGHSSDIRLTVPSHPSQIPLQRYQDAVSQQVTFEQPALVQCPMQRGCRTYRGSKICYPKTQEYKPNQIFGGCRVLRPLRKSAAIVSWFSQHGGKGPKTNDAIVIISVL